MTTRDNTPPRPSTPPRPPLSVRPPTRGDEDGACHVQVRHLVAGRRRARDGDRLAPVARDAVHDPHAGASSRVVSQPTIDVISHDTETMLVPSRVVSQPTIDVLPMTWRRCDAMRCLCGHIDRSSSRAPWVARSSSRQETERRIDSPVRATANDDGGVWSSPILRLVRRSMRRRCVLPLVMGRRRRRPVWR